MKGDICLNKALVSLKRLLKYVEGSNEFVWLEINSLQDVKTVDEELFIQV